jgi:uncharacterized protein YndB with AHSA1/START domain
MVKVEASVMVDHPVEVVWKFVTDWPNSPKWHIEAGFVELRQTSTGPLAVGTTLLYRGSKFPKINDLRVVEYEPNRKLSLEFTSGPMKGTIVTMSFEAIEGKTRFTETDDYKLSGFWKLVVPFMGGQVKRNVEGRVGTVKRILESKSQS